MTYNGRICHNKNHINFYGGKAHIFAKIPSNGGEYVLPGCEIDVTWPSDYGEVWWTEWDCLKDGQGMLLRMCC